MKLIYNGSFEQLKEFGFEIDFREWFQFKDKETGVYVYVMPVSKELKWGVSVTEKTGIPTIVFDLIQAGLVEKEEEHE